MKKDRVLCGMRFGMLIVESEAERAKGFRKWNVLCDCGERRCVYHHCLYSGHTRSCGCLGRKARALACTKHGDNKRSGKSIEHTSWWEMLQRCGRKGHVSYKNYGGRGITVCDRWLKSYEAFLLDMGRKPGKGYSLDRIDMNGNYEPGNCRWATKKEQLRNTRKNMLVDYLGRKVCVSELAEITGIPRERLRWRLNNGWSVERAVS